MNNFSVRTLKCPHCSAPLRVARSDSTTYSCGSCGSVIDLSTEAGKVIGSVPKKYSKPFSMLKLGARGRVAREEIEIVGRLAYEADIWEWDDEDGEFCNEGKWRFDEWLCVTQSGAILFLAEDSEGMMISRTFTPVAPELPKRPAAWTGVDGTQRRIREYGDSKLVYFEGEFSWAPSIGDRSRYVETDPYPVISIECNLDDTGQPEEIEFFSSEPIERLDLYRMLGLKEAEAVEAQTVRDNRSWVVWGGVFIGLAVFLVLSGLVLGRVSGTRLFEQTVSLSSISQDGYSMGPIQLDSKGSIYELRLSMSMPINSSAYGVVELTDQEMEPINAVEHDFWYETGVDEGERWTESDLSQSLYFKLQEPGIYNALVSVEEVGGASSVNHQGTATVIVYKGVILERYFYFAAVIAILLAISTIHYKKFNPVFGLLGLLTIAWIIYQASDDDD